MITIKISLGEYLDRLSILRLKSQWSKSKEKREKALEQVEVLQRALAEAGQTYAAKDYQRLLEVNSELWAIEDRIRELLPVVRGKDLDLALDAVGEYVAKAQEVPTKNDLRAKIKREIDEKAGDTPEIKDYT